MERQLYPANKILEHLEGRNIITTRHDVRVLDPIYQEPIERFVLPRGIKEDPAIAQGYDYLTYMGQRNRLTVHLLLAPHSSGQDFDDTLNQYGRILQDGQLFGMEVNWMSPKTESGEHPPTYDELLFDTSPGRGEFQHAQYDWLTKNGKTILPCEYPNNSTSTIFKHQKELWDAYIAATNATDIDPVQQNKIRATTTLACQTLRHWTLLGQFGNWLSQHNPRAERMAVPLMLGNWHAYSKQRLESFGVNAQPHFVRNPLPSNPDMIDYANIFMHTIANGRATHSQLAVKLPY